MEVAVADLFGPDLLGLGFSNAEAGGEGAGGLDLSFSFDGKKEMECQNFSFSFPRPSLLLRYKRSLRKIHRFEFRPEEEDVEDDAEAEEVVITSISICFRFGSASRSAPSTVGSSSSSAHWCLGLRRGDMIWHAGGWIYSAASDPVLSRPAPLYLGGDRRHHLDGVAGVVFVSCSVLDMHVKFGCLDDACKVFELMPERDVVVWNAMITGFVRSGRSAEVLDMFRRLKLEGMEIDWRLIPSVLNACGCNGELMRGKEVHGRVIRCLVFDSDVVIGNALIDMHGKCRCLGDSQRVFAWLPNGSPLTSPPLPETTTPSSITIPMINTAGED